MIIRVFAQFPKVIKMICETGCRTAPQLPNDSSVIVALSRWSPTLCYQFCYCEEVRRIVHSVYRGAETGLVLFLDSEPLSKGTQLFRIERHNLVRRDNKHRNVVVQKGPIVFGEVR
jgi:hypothetical protein